MSAITFILLLLGTFVLVSSGLILRAFFRVRGEPLVIIPDGRAAEGQAAVPAPPDPAELQPADGTVRMSGAHVPAAAPLDKPGMAILSRWYAGRECAVCRREIGPIQGIERRLGLLNIASPTQYILTWDEIPTDHLPDVLDSHLPVCAGCTLADSFRRQFPDRVTDRADTTARDRAFH